MNKRKLILLARNGASTRILYNSLKNDFEIGAIIVEKPVSAKEFIKKRVKKLGLVKVAGQVLFQFSIAPILRLISAKRIKEILNVYELEDTPMPAEKIIRLNSVNDNECLLLLKEINPEVVIVNGTRIISKAILNSIPAKFVNIHAGITPKYRNVHGAYWALVNNDPENCGVTVHLVDAGIDTGNIIYQKKIPVSSRDNFVTYPFLQLAEGIILLKKALLDIVANRVKFQKNDLESKVWYHPTIWQYIFYRIVHNKK